MTCVDNISDVKVWPGPGECEPHLYHVMSCVSCNGVNAAAASPRRSQLGLLYCRVKTKTI